MNKQELIAKVAEDAGLTKTQAQAAVEAILDNISNVLKDGGEVRLIGFGTFSVSHRAARMARIPGTGETKQVPASNMPKFKAGKGLKDAVNS